MKAASLRNLLYPSFDSTAPACMHACMHACTRMHLYVFACTCMQLFRASACTCMHACTHACMHAPLTQRCLHTTVLHALVIAAAAAAAATTTTTSSLASSAATVSSVRVCLLVNALFSLVEQVQF